MADLPDRVIPNADDRVRFKLSDDRCLWLRYGAIDAVGDFPDGTVVVLSTGMKLKLEGWTPDEVMMEFTTAPDWTYSAPDSVAMDNDPR